MAAKKEYQTLLKHLAYNGTQTVLYNKFTELAVDAEDMNVKKLAAAISAHINPGSLAKSSSKKFSCLSLLPGLTHSSATPSGKKFGDEIILAKKIADDGIASIEPDWMIQARAANWGPLPPKV